MDPELEVMKERLTPAQRDEVQVYFMRRYVAGRRFAKPERRRHMLAKLHKPSPVIQAAHRWPQPWRRDPLGLGSAPRG